MKLCCLCLAEGKKVPGRIAGGNVIPLCRGCRDAQKKRLAAAKDQPTVCLPLSPRDAYVAACLRDNFSLSMLASQKSGEALH